MSKKSLDVYISDGFVINLLHTKDAISAGKHFGNMTKKGNPETFFEGENSTDCFGRKIFGHHHT